MDKPTNLIDFETMLLGRHLTLHNPRPAAAAADSTAARTRS